jgi:hypothetical protein
MGRASRRNLAACKRDLPAKKNIGALPENGAKMGCLTHSILVKRQNQRDFHGVVRG